MPPRASSATHGITSFKTYLLRCSHTAWSRSICGSVRRVLTVSRTTHDTAPACSADVFVLNQHEAATIERPPDWWSDAFSDAVRTVGHTLLVLQPWFAPRALQRAWCLWEIFCTLQGGIQLDVLLNPGQVEAFRDNLARADVSCLHARNAPVTDAYAHAVIGFQERGCRVCRGHATRRCQTF